MKKSSTPVQSELNTDDRINPREIFDELKTPYVIAEQIQHEVDRIISECHSVDWNEDFLTFQIVGCLRNILSGYRIPDIDNSLISKKFDLEAYKLTGKAEQKHGDIAIVVTRTFNNQSQPISGVGFYEAKASSVEPYDYRYPSFSYNQLRRLVSNTPRLTYLLYDKHVRSVTAQEWPFTTKEQESYSKNKMVHAYTIDANFLKQCKDINKASGLVGQTFGYHFVHKILSGRELDYSRPAKQTIKRWLKSTRRTKALVVSIFIHEQDVNTIDDKLKLPEYKKLELPGFEKLELPSMANSQILKLNK